MKIKTDDLIGLPLRYAVARAIGGKDLWWDTVSSWWIKINGADKSLTPGWSESQSFLPDLDGRLGVTLLEENKITVAFDHYEPPERAWGSSWTRSHDPVGDWLYAYGPTLLVAGMRCLVRSRLGDEVDIPERLMP